MTAMKISQLATASALGGQELVPLVQNGETRAATVSSLRQGLLPTAGGTVTGAVAIQGKLSAGAGLAVTGGTLGVGTSAPAGNMTVSNSGLDTVVYIDNTNAGPGGRADLRLRTLGSSGNNYLTFGDTENFNAGLVGYGHASDQMIFWTAGVERLALLANGDIRPTADAGQRLGTAGRRWKEIYAETAVIQTSDARLKRDIEPCALGLDFIRALEPVQYRYADVQEPAVTVTRTERRPVTTRERRRDMVIREVDGQYRLVPEETEVEVPLMRTVPLHDADGQPLLDGAGQPVLHQAPVYEDVREEIVERPAIDRCYRRLHTGFTAQQISGLLDRTDHDYAMHIRDVETGEEGLRYEELIAPLVAAVQTLADRIERSEERNKILAV